VRQPARPLRFTRLTNEYFCASPPPLSFALCRQPPLCFPLFHGIFPTLLLPDSRPPSLWFTCAAMAQTAGRRWFFVLHLRHDGFEVPSTAVQLCFSLCQQIFHRELERPDLMYQLHPDRTPLLPRPPTYTARRVPGLPQTRWSAMGALSCSNLSCCSIDQLSPPPGLLCAKMLPDPALLFPLHLLQRILLTSSICPSVFSFTSCHSIYVHGLNPVMRPRFFIHSSIGIFLPLLNWVSNCYISFVF
jgi:hypothetical protein